MKAETMSKTETKSFKSLTMVVMQDYEQNMPIANCLHSEYNKIETEMLDENKGDKDIVVTRNYPVLKSITRAGFDTAFKESLKTYDFARTAEHIVKGNAETNQLPIPEYERIFAMIFVGLSDIQQLKRGCDQADSHPEVQRIGVSFHSLNDTLSAFYLTSENVTSEKLKHGTDLDLLLVPDLAISDEMKVNLPKNVVLFDLQGTPQGNAVEIAKKTNAYFLGM